ncbi:MAG: hypothetical protein GX882_00590 [Methanomicrobiales archaeon]|nr:hypothetical protein [Methanomicrobiales archaeon]
MIACITLSWIRRFVGLIPLLKIRLSILAGFWMEVFLTEIFVSGLRSWR